MRDKSLGIFLMMVFGISGATVLLLAWLRPMLEWDRILTIVIGFTGLAAAFFIASRLHWQQVPEKGEQLAAGMEAGEEPRATGKPGRCR